MIFPSVLTPRCKPIELKLILGVAGAVKLEVRRPVRKMSKKFVNKTTWKEKFDWKSKKSVKNIQHVNMKEVLLSNSEKSFIQNAISDSIVSLQRIDFIRKHINDGVIPMNFHCARLTNSNFYLTSVSMVAH
jgi:hypothetical protein